MTATERFYKIDRLINERRVVSFRTLQEALEVSPATLKRDLEYMRNRLGAPIIWDRQAGGYRFEKTNSVSGNQYELPGLWFSAAEIHALLTTQHLLANLDPGGLLAPHVEPLQARLNGLLGSTNDPAEEIRRRVLLMGVGKRQIKLAHFEKVGSALLRRKRLHLSYYARSTGVVTEREVSPQRLVYYRENWYLDAWCDLRHALRAFSVDSIQYIEVLKGTAREIPLRTVDRVLGSGYGIFLGKDSDVRIARLRFGKERARWVSAEQWHPKQRGIWLEDGDYQLEVPYTDDRELLMDILKFGADVVVEAPDELRARVATQVRAMAEKYFQNTCRGSFYEPHAGA